MEIWQYILEFVIADWTGAITTIEWLFLPCSLFLMLPHFQAPINLPKAPKSVNWELDLITSSSYKQGGPALFLKYKLQSFLKEKLM